MFYYISKKFMYFYIKIFYRLEVTGINNIPTEGGFIFCGNHISNMDPVVIGITNKRKINFLAKKELFDNRFLSKFLKSISAFPVDRNKSDIKAFKKIIEIVNDGKIVGIFAQGTRTKSNYAKNGVVFFALKANCSVVPVGITSNYKLFSKIKVNYGKPISFEKYKNSKIKSDLLNKLTEDVMLDVFCLTDYDFKNKN